MSNAVFNQSTDKEQSEANSDSLKGANQRRRSVLGRGLGALMSPSFVSVEPSKGPAGTSAAGAQVAAPVGAAPVAAAAGAEISQPTASTIAQASSTAASAPQSTVPVREAAPRDDVEGMLLYLPIEQVFPNPTQPRKDFKPEEIESLTQSIRETGMLQPILVRKRKLNGLSAGGLPYSGYEIVAGERRWRAATQAGLNKVPAIVKHLTDRQTLELSIVENIQREELNAIEEAYAYQRLMNEFGATQEEIAQSVGRDRASISNSIRLLRLPDPIRDLLVTGRISAGHGRALLVLPTPEEQQALVDRILGEGLSVRAAEQAVSGKGKSNKSAVAARKGAEEAPNHNIAALENRLRDRLGTKVKLSIGRGGAGELRITFFSESELQNILEKIGA